MRQEQQRQQLCIMRVRLDQKLQNSIEKHTSILVQLQSAYKELRNWKILGKRYIQKDIDDMNNYRMTLINEFVRIRSQCKCLGEIFNSLDDDKK
ncbi:hypothetical protein RhiirA1_32619 [Rhizophagus irregularis]|nr:hypothetical protein RhiirA1_32619 [Rhizophagus irregularis]